MMGFGIDHLDCYFICYASVELLPGLDTLRRIVDCSDRLKMIPTCNDINSSSIELFSVIWWKDKPQFEDHKTNSLPLCCWRAEEERFFTRSLRGF
jgi:hypothetical protein